MRALKENQMRHLRFLAIVSTTLCLSLLFVPGETTAKIIFTTRIEAGVEGIYVMEDDGTGVMLLHTDTRRRSPSAPRWSPDGKQIVFRRFANPPDWQKKEIVVMNADGTNLRVLPLPKGASGHPVFSPDGASVLFTRHQTINNELVSHICVIDLASGKIKKLAPLGVNSPDWSPDGRQIVFSLIPKLGREGANFWIMDAAGRHARELLPPLPAPPPLIDRVYARWSPDGKKIVYHEYESIYNAKDGFIPQAYRYYIYDLATRRSKPLRIPKTYRCSGLDWMDDGKSIVFSAMEVKLKVPIEGVLPPYHRYKYRIGSRKLTRLYVPPDGNAYGLDWIGDDVLSVTPQGRKKVTWGALKK